MSLLKEIKQKNLRSSLNEFQEKAISEWESNTIKGWSKSVKSNALFFLNCLNQIIQLIKLPTLIQQIFN